MHTYRHEENTGGNLFGPGAIDVIDPPPLPGGAVSRVHENGTDRKGCVRCHRTTHRYPDIKQTPRSDWVNVKTATPAAIGDGVSDDTAAIQAALDRIGNQTANGPRDPRAKLTVYLPAGTYRITSTLTISDAGKAYQGQLGIMLIGDGALTRIVWDGLDDAKARMLVTDGTGYARFDGLVFDGANKAGVGLDHASVRTFETEQDHYNLSFHNLKTAGIRIGTTSTASSEIIYNNCVFVSCESGIQLLAFNDYDNTIFGCEFRQCNRGIVLGFGTNGYVRDCHFEGSTNTDIITYGPQHPCSVRRCTSVGSHRFLEWSSSIATVAIEDCHVDGWTATDGAILLHTGSLPTTLFDCAFTHPPGGSAPVHNEAQPLVYSNDSFVGSAQLLAAPASPQYSPAVEIPAGKLGSAVTSAAESFLRPVSVRKIVYDARELGAIGDGVADDTAAVQATIDKARGRGAGALAYFPPGSYKVSKTIDMTGSHYVVGGGGSGFYTEFAWAGPDGQPILHIHDVKAVRLERLCVGSTGNANNSADILQDGTTPGTVDYESVWVWGTYGHKPGLRGLHIVGAPQGSTITLRHISGNTTFTDCSRAQILIDAAWEGAMTIGGATETVRDGFFGALTRFNTNEPYGLYVTDNQNAVIADYYTESADAYLNLSGNNALPPGRVTVAGIKVDTHIEPVIKIDNYKGQLAAFDMQFYGSNFQITGTGESLLDVLLVADLNTSNDKTLKVSLGPNGLLTSFGNYWAGGPPNNVTPDGLARVATAMDDFRNLGLVDIKVNHPGK